MCHRKPFKFWISCFGSFLHINYYYCPPFTYSFFIYFSHDMILWVPLKFLTNCYVISLRDLRNLEFIHRITSTKQALFYDCWWCNYLFWLLEFFCCCASIHQQGIHFIHPILVQQYLLVMGWKASRAFIRIYAQLKWDCPSTLIGAMVFNTPFFNLGLIVHAY